MAKQQDDALFEESSRGAIGVGKVILFLVSSVLVFGGVILMSYGFNTELSDSTQMWTFVIGQMTILVGFAIPWATPYASTVKTK